MAVCFRTGNNDPMSQLLSALANWRPFRALVVGDFMLDEYIYGDAERLSADAPVPVLLVRRSESMAGGSANVCLDLAALRGEVKAFGVVGDDAPGNRLRASLEGQGINVSGLIVDPSRPTTVKQNLVGLAQARHPQKMFRVDFESREPLSANVMNQVLQSFESAVAECDIVCLEDYNKGVCSESLCQRVIELSRRAGKPVFVDPAKLSDYRRYRGATVMTPNRTEAEFATGMPSDGESSHAHNTAVARFLLGSLDLEAVVLTLDKHGALLHECGGSVESIPTVARKVYDVTGAGDMFLAGLAAARANALSWSESVRFANAAAGLEVEIFGVAPIPFERVHHSIMLQSRNDAGKLRTRDELLLEVEAYRKSGRRIIFTNGCFDILHAGHVSLLARAAAVEGEKGFLVVGLNDDASVRRLKGPSRPVNPEADRARVLGALEAVGAVTLFAEDTPEDLIRAVRPDVLVKGADYTKDRVVGHEIVEAYGGRVELIDLVAGRSTTEVLRKAAQQSQ